ncbi:type IV toxin-antitoxin system AbiEi family antitoxin domain-containing protein, partial [Phycicoccus flavus]
MDDFSLLAQLHDGVFITSEALRLGVSRQTLSRAVTYGRLRRLARGLYATGPAPARDEDRHLELCRALRVEYPDAVLAGHSAVVALGLPVWGADLGSALLHRPVERQLRRSGATIRPGDPGEVVVETPVAPATAAVTAVVQAALDHGTLAGLVSADAALHTRTIDARELTAEIERRAGHRHVQRALAMLQLVDPAAESPGESRLRAMLVTSGLTVESQVVVRDEDGSFVARADLRIAGTRVLVEFDGRVKYADGGVAAVVAEKYREDRLRSLGWLVV